MICYDRKNDEVTSLMPSLPPTLPRAPGPGARNQQNLGILRVTCRWGSITAADTRVNKRVGKGSVSQLASMSAVPVCSS